MLRPFKSNLSQRRPTLNPHRYQAPVARPESHLWFVGFATCTGLEPVTLRSTGGRSNR